MWKYAPPPPSITQLTHRDHRGMCAAAANELLSASLGGRLFQFLRMSNDCKHGFAGAAPKPHLQLPAGPHTTMADLNHCGLRASTLTWSMAPWILDVKVDFFIQELSICLNPHGCQAVKFLLSLFTHNSSFNRLFIHLLWRTELSYCFKL